MTDYIPHCNQIKLHNSKKKTVLIVAATRSGKTESLIRDAIKRSWNNDTKTPPILICAPTYRMVFELLELPIARNLINQGLLQKHHVGSNKIVLRNGNQIIFRTANKSDVDTSTRGLNVSRVYVDEAALIDPYAIEVLRTRLIQTDGSIIFATTPKGKANWIYEEYFRDGKRKDVEYIRYELLDNPTIKKIAIQHAKETMNELMFRQEIQAEFVSLYENRVYFAFNSAINTFASAPREEATQIYIGVDWNIDKNAWIAIKRYADGTMEAIYEGYGAQNTQELAQQIIRKYGTDVIICPDRTGSIRQHSGITNFQLFEQAGLLNIEGSGANPGRVARYNNTNAAFRNALEQNMLKLSISGCPQTISELEEISYQKGTDRPDTFNDKYGHRTDALGYVIFYLTDGEVIRKTNKTQSVVQRYLQDYQDQSMAMDW